ncbi:MAG: Cys-tRNA(Pro) deacylase [Bacilli bacterium]|jgi:Cys-tRNA(Pro)/Cys-tRNA(Cys) deacylase|nr:Cys-tRNA(Pro) deacylase [Bacilli bacterium]
MHKTTVMRILEKNHINYQIYDYSKSEAISGLDVIKVLNQDGHQVFKTLVTIGKSKQYYVFLVPVINELDLKKAALVVKEKHIEMIKSSDLLPLTGYVHGGCSPIGMKKSLVTIIDQSANNYPTIIYNGGKIGFQVETTLADLAKLITITLADIIK